MRFLFSFAGGSGHFEPLLPPARAAGAAGHTVAFAGQPAMVPVVEAAGFPTFATGGATLTGAAERLPLLKLDPKREERDLREGFADRFARERADTLLDLCAAWQPDLLVCDEMDFGALIAAERLGLPYATVLVIAVGSFVRPEVVAAPLNELRAEHGLPPDPDLAMLSRYLVLSPIPPGYRDPAFPLLPTAHAIRPPTLDQTQPDLAPVWDTHLPGAPTVYFTLGTVFNVESGDLFERVTAGLREMQINLVAMVGRELDPAEFGPQPANVHIAQYIPQAAILPHCNLVVSHGGSGSVLGALAHGLPMVLLPMGGRSTAERGALCRPRRCVRPRCTGGHAGERARGSSDAAGRTGSRPDAGGNRRPAGARACRETARAPGSGAAAGCVGVSWGSQQRLHAQFLVSGAGGWYDA